MKNNKYQITGNKGRLPHLGFVACYLLIFLLYACEDGYQPTVRISIDKPELNVEIKESKELKVTVVKSSRITDEYQVEVKVNPVNVITLDIKEIDGYVTSDNSGKIYVMSTATITFDVEGVKTGVTTIIIKVLKPSEDPNSPLPDLIATSEVTVTVTPATPATAAP